MKIISLNAWCGRAGLVVHEFFKNNTDIDIFCLQEVDLDGTKFDIDVTGINPPAGDQFLFHSIQNILPNHYGYFSSQLGKWFGICIYIKDELYRNITASGELVISNEQQKFVDYKTWFRRTMQWIDFEKNGKQFTVLNIHCLWMPGFGKDDSPERIEQSKNIVNFLETKKKRNIILIGDFNLNPNTESIKIIEYFSLTNLIKKYNIIDTRTSFYKKENRFADYAFISKGIKVKEFKVLPDVVSDHAPLYLEIE
jgi:endonuclease/exonuclease/phosphatase family metal-dependent hydrolase